MRISDWSSDVCSSDLARARGLLDLAVGRRPDPLQRPDAALVADLPVEVHLAEPAQHRRHALLDLPLVGVALVDDLLRQAMGREQHPRRPFVIDLLQCAAQPLDHRRAEASLLWKAADAPGERRAAPTPSPPLPP